MIFYVIGTIVAFLVLFFVGGTIIKSGKEEAVGWECDVIDCKDCPSSTNLEDISRRRLPYHSIPTRDGSCKSCCSSALRKMASDLISRATGSGANSPEPSSSTPILVDSQIAMPEQPPRSPANAGPAETSPLLTTGQQGPAPSHSHYGSNGPTQDQALDTVQLIDRLEPTYGNANPRHS